MESWEIIKDIIVVLTPCIVAIITHIGNKKTKKDIQLELEKNLKEKDAETSQIIQKINAELESKKIITSWNNSMPQTNEYTKEIGVERYGNISGLDHLISTINKYINNNILSSDELIDIKNMLLKVNLPFDEEHLYPIEIPYLIDYKKLLKRIDDLISAYSQS